MKTFLTCREIMTHRECQKYKNEMEFEKNYPSVSDYYEEIKPYLFDKELKNISMNKWSELSDDKSYKEIGRDVVNEYFISTIWTGLSTSQQPFETIIFDSKDYSLAEFKYHTELEAKLTHEEIVNIFSLLDREEIMKIFPNEDLSE